MNLDSGSSRPQQNSNVIGEDFRSLLNTNSRENSEITVETTRMISEEIFNQMSRKLNEIRKGLNSQIHEAINSVMTETVLPSIQNTLGTHWEMHKNHGKIVPGSVLSRKTVDKCLVKVQ